MNKYTDPDLLDHLHRENSHLRANNHRFENWIGELQDAAKLRNKLLFVAIAAAVVLGVL